MKTALGLMSGTSMDGIDIALVKTDGLKSVEFGPTLAVEYSADVRRAIEAGLTDALAIKQKQERQERLGKLGQLEQDLTQLHAEAVIQFQQKHSISNAEIDLVGFHGQTILHRPEKGLTVQLGDGEMLAKAVGIDVVYDMRARDMEQGGQGAPLVPVFHQALAASLNQQKPVCFVNIGGISNISYVDDTDLVAFDTGPGNALIDQWMKAKSEMDFDHNGDLSAQGEIQEHIVQHYLDNPYFNLPGPKSLDRNDFQPLNPDSANIQDGARTLAHLTAASIIKATDHLPAKPKTWIICGGGRLNRVIMNDLRFLAEKHGARVLSADDVNLQGDMLEAQAFAYLAVRSVQKLPLTFPKTTGCTAPVSGGVLAGN